MVKNTTIVVKFTGGLDKSEKCAILENEYGNGVVGKETRAKNKLILLESFGYKCFRCGLDATVENLPIWQFHHIDKYKKKYNVGSLLYKASCEFESYLQEIKEDCVMVCANCHFIITSDKYARYEIYHRWTRKKELSQMMFNKIEKSGMLV